MYRQPPKELVDLALYASMMKNGVATFDGAVKQMTKAVTDHLEHKGWDLSDAPLREFVTCTLPGFSANEVRYTIDTTLGEYLHTGEALAALLEKPEILKDLQAAYDDARIQLKAIYATDPLAAPALEKSYLRKSFDAIKNSQLESKVPKLNAATEAIVAGLSQYGHLAVGREFWQRMHQTLKDKDWPFSHDPQSTLMNELLRLTYTSPSSVADIRSRMYDIPTNFIVNHADDVKAAAETVFKALEQEAKTRLGINVNRSAALIKRSMN